MIELFKPYYELTKSSIVYLVVVTVAFGYYLGAGHISPYFTFFSTLASSFILCAGVCALNQVIEWKKDLKMKRTQNRPIPRGAISPRSGLIFSLSLMSIGLLMMYWIISPLMALGGLVTCGLYIFVYTPLKIKTWLNTLIGAIPGALPPMGGWLAGTGEITMGAWLLFLVLFLWQHPHFYIIAWIYKEDYLEGGFKMISSGEISGDATFRQIIIYSILLVVSSLLLSQIEPLNELYLIGAIILGIWFLRESFKVVKDRSLPSAKQFLRATVLYLPVLFVLALVDIWVL